MKKYVALQYNNSYAHMLLEISDDKVNQIKSILHKSVIVENPLVIAENSTMKKGNRIIIAFKEEIEFPDDKAALTWFKLNY